MTVAALYVATGGVYFGLPDVDPWDEARDARLYDGPHPVVAHPPCSSWCQMAAVNRRRYGRAIGDDGGCFWNALSAVRRWGGVLEHPAESIAWRAFALQRPELGRWSRSYDGGWVTEVWQSAYGHRARKRTWLYYYSGCDLLGPVVLDWSAPRGTAVIGNDKDWKDSRPRLSKKEAKATPIAFRDVLLNLARHSRGLVAA